VSLVARQLEENGISTVILGSALDIVEYCGVPRFLFTDFPLGNPCGRPFDNQSQQEILAQAFTLLETANRAGTTRRNPMVWHKGSEWKTNYMKVDDSNRAKLLQAGNARRLDQAAVRERRRD
jgi:hypothetical protein